MTQKIIKKTEETVLTVKENRGVTYLSFPILEDTGWFPMLFPPVLAV